MKRILLTGVLLLLSIMLNAQGWGQIQKIVPGDRELGDHFGYAVAMSGDYALIGAEWDDVTSLNTGSAYVYKKANNGNWIEHQKLTAPDKRANDIFGFSVDINGNFLIIGARAQDYDASNSNFISAAGAAYIYEKDTNDNWVFVQKLIASHRETTRQFGRCVAISSNFAIVGVDQENYDVAGENFVQNAGAAYVFERNNAGEWIEVQKIVASERSTFDYFGYNGLSIDGNYAVIGAMQEDEDENEVNTMPSAGSAYIFERNTSGVWNEIQKIVASDRTQGAYFGWSLAIDGNSIVVGSNQDNNFTGAAYVFEKDENDIWNQVQKLTASNSDNGDQFGFDLDIDGNRIIIGARYRDIGSPGDDGGAYIFEKQSGTWEETAFVYDMFNQTSEYFGYAVAISGDFALAGAYQDGEDENEENDLGSSGAVFVFDVNEPNTLSVFENNLENQIKAYPNPVVNSLYLDLGKIFSNIDITILDILGQKVFFKNYSSIQTIDLPFNVSKGMYLVEVRADNQKTSVLKIIKH
ncbi:T9SS type A sorting domain-containing protein [Psychroserpens sp. Hel_I_66]|uniref:T9SS type A sorting domain-containing protein n=1 Tax=Psychroserpens sp. Hel_I_66 TaxID=1250004 RepID=UPI0006478C74|nr:T9SS type A sorting domain-containing protein [Psychroserpens sp. Hel_I_66]